jgi:hypothetical protein
MAMTDDKLVLLPSTGWLRFNCLLQFDPVSDGAQSSPVSELSSTKCRPLLEAICIFVAARRP